MKKVPKNALVYIFVEKRYVQKYAGESMNMVYQKLSTCSQSVRNKQEDLKLTSPGALNSWQHIAKAGPAPVVIKIFSGVSIFLLDFLWSHEQSVEQKPRFPCIRPYWSNETLAPSCDKAFLQASPTSLIGRNDGLGCPFPFLANVLVAWLFLHVQFLPISIKSVSSQLSHKAHIRICWSLWSQFLLDQQLVRMNLSQSR